MSFRIWLNEDLQIQLRKIRDMLASFAVTGERDSPRWRWESTGLFSVRSNYEHLCSNEYGTHYNLIWKAKLPLKIKICVLLSRDSFIWFGLAAICWAIWISRNKSCFEKKLINSPTEILCSASSFLKYWAGLQVGQNKEELELSAAALLKTALHFHAQAHGDGARLVLLR
ncbi:hypothetical protein PVAP13_5KG374614 [Panicum virgatum]|nr:hypothetical protein PVAP13_5KG374614 [Panicum virgatum]